MSAYRRTNATVDDRAPLAAEFPHVDFERLLDGEDEMSKEHFPSELNSTAATERAAKLLHWLWRRPESQIAIVSHWVFMKHPFKIFPHHADLNADLTTRDADGDSLAEGADRADGRKGGAVTSFIPVKLPLCFSPALVCHRSRGPRLRLHSLCLSSPLSRVRSHLSLSSTSPLPHIQSDTQIQLFHARRQAARKHTRGSLLTHSPPPASPTELGEQGLLNLLQLTHAATATPHTAAAASSLLWPSGLSELAAYRLVDREMRRSRSPVAASTHSSS